LNFTQEISMFSTLKSCARSAGAVGASLALVGIAALPLSAFAAEAAKPTSASMPIESGANSQLVVRDADSGLLRAATPEEAQALQSSRGNAVLRRSAAPTTQARFHSSGARGARLTDEFMSYSVLVRQPDGKLLELCFESKEAADEALKAAPIAKTATLPTE
jgi:hypothetical protein